MCYKIVGFDLLSIGYNATTLQKDGYWIPKKLHTEILNLILRKIPSFCEVQVGVASCLRPPDMRDPAKQGLGLRV